VGTWWRYGLTKKSIRRLGGIAALLSAVEGVIDRRFHLHVTPLSRTTRNHIMAEVKCYLGFLIEFLGWEAPMVASGRALMDPYALAAYWEYLATPEELGGRDCVRTTMRTKCNHLAHFIRACSVLRLEPVGPGVTYEGIIKWWGRVTLKCGQLKLGPRQGSATRGARVGRKVEEWEAFKEALTAMASRVLCTANDLTVPRSAALAREVQMCCVLGMMGALVPPQRAAAVCLLNRGTKSNGQGWPCRQDECDIGTECKGNHVGWDEGHLYMCMLHYKNAGRSAEFTGARRRDVVHSHNALGRLMVGLLEHQVRWASHMLASIVEEEDVGALFVDPVNGLPFRDSGMKNTPPGSTTLTAYVKHCMRDLHLISIQEGELDVETPWLPEGVGPMEFRFAYVGRFMAITRGKESGWVARMKRDLARAMTTTETEWDETYSQGADANEDMDWAASQLQQLEYEGFQEPDGHGLED
jgi:hypothetical protein